MRQFSRHLTICSLVALFLLTLSGCAPQSPEERVAAIRAQYTVRLESFTVKEPTPEFPEAPAEEEAEAVEAEAGAVEAEAVEPEAAPEDLDLGEPEEIASGPRPMDVVLHLLVGFGGEESLPGITVEVTQADPFGKEKEPTLLYIETAGMVKSDVKQVDLKLEGVEFEDGDGFSVLLSQAVPAAERSKYREFAEAGP